MNRIDKGYNGNPNLKPTNVHHSLTKKQAEEFLKCQESCEYFIEKYMKIIHVDRGIIPFKLYDFQKKMAKTMVDERFVICKLPRQSGKTTTVAAVILWHVIFFEAFSVGILANKMAQSKEILERIQLAYENLPKWLQQGIVEWNKGNIKLENASTITAAATTGSALRGQSLSMLYLDEFAFVPSNIQETFMRSTYPTITSGQSTKVLVTSTPNGIDHFYKIWNNAQHGRNDYVPIEVNWWDVPGRDEAWKKQTIANTSEDQFRVEFECEFIGSQHTLISPGFLSQMVAEEPISDNDGIAVYAEPEFGRIYWLNCDVARGVQQDYSVITVIDITETPYRLVARYKRNDITVQLFPQVIYHLAQRYNHGYVMVEINDIGSQVANILHEDYEYENVVWTSSKGRHGVHITQGFGQATSHPGLSMTVKTKKLGCSNLKTLVETRKLWCNDLEVIKEFTQFVSLGQTWGAEPGNHDDVVMSLVMFAWATTQQFFKDVSETDYVKDIQFEKSQEMESVMPLGFFDDGSDDGWTDINYVL